MKLYFSTSLTDRSQGESLTNTKAHQRLVSYHYLRKLNNADDLIKEYANTGKGDPRKNKANVL